MTAARRHAAGVVDDRLVVGLTERELSLILIVVAREAKAEAERHARMIARPAGTHKPETIAAVRRGADLYADLRDKLEAS